MVGQDLVVETQPLRTGSLYHQQFIRALTRRGVERLTVARGLDTEECVRFLTPMALGGVPISTRYITVGRVELQARPVIEEGPGPGTGAGGGAGAGPGGDSAIEALTAQSVDGARDAFTEFRTDRRGGLVRLEQVVWSLMDALQRATREILPLAPLKTHDDYTFVHSVNVSLLTLAQARSFGIEGARLHAIGLAAFLHDIGKLKIPLDVLNKPGKLEGDEWRIMMGHAQEGATHLCGVEGSHPLAILVAYEHHMRYDGQPNYPVPRIGRRPTLASQMTSIADVYDAICTTRPVREGALARVRGERAHRARGHLPQPRAGGELRPHGRRRAHRPPRPGHDRPPLLDDPQLSPGGFLHHRQRLLRRRRPLPGHALPRGRRALAPGRGRRRSSSWP